MSIYGHIPALLGAISAVILISSKDNEWWRVVGHVVAGATFAIFTGQELSTYVRVSVELGHYLAGLFGVAIITKAFRVIDKIDVISILKERLK